jgi:hypothetical protein
MLVISFSAFRLTASSRYYDTVGLMQSKALRVRSCEKIDFGKIEHQ